jgi:hypothetical protein
MRKLALALAAALLLVTLRSRPAEAGCGGDCPPWIDALGVAFAAGLVGGYAYGTGQFIYRDLTEDRQSLDYAATEIGFNTLMGALFTGATVDAIRHRSAGGAAVLGAFALTHTVLVGHGAWRVYQHRGELRPEPVTAARFAALGYASNTLIWALQIPGRHGRGYGIAEAAVNAPIAAGLGYLAAERARDGDTKYAALFGGMAAVSGALALHGAYTAVFQRPRITEDLDFGLDLPIPADVAPTVVTDGKAVAPGLGASGTW